LAGNAHATIVGTKVDHSLVAYDGGAAYIRDDSSLEIVNSTIQSNFAQFGGGVLCSENSTLNIAHSVLRGNAAVKKGGAIQAVEQCKVGDGASSLNSANSSGAHLVEFMYAWQVARLFLHFSC
jgi:hypothetical protein